MTNKYTHRITTCEHTKKEVIQERNGKKWLCLHQEDEMLDSVAVEGFKAGFGSR